MQEQGQFLLLEEKEFINKFNKINRNCIYRIDTIFLIYVLTGSSNLLCNNGGSMEKYSRILGGVFGDVLGGTLEFFTHAEGKKKYGYLKDIIGGGCW